MDNFTMKEKDYIFFKNLAEHRTGIVLSSNKIDHLTNRILVRLHELKLNGITEYCDLLRRDPLEVDKFIDMITNLSTDFFREKHHFDYLKDNFLPEFFKRNNKLRIWSAGCATGEEPYSIATTIYETIIHPEQFDIEILATDINTLALESTTRGVYKKSQFENLGDHKKWFHQTPENSDWVVIDDRLKRMVHIKRLNLLELWPFETIFDIIFCRNVTIYLIEEVKKELFKRFDQFLKVDGLLILGHSENLIDETRKYVNLGKTIYKKVKP